MKNKIKKSTTEIAFDRIRKPIAKCGSVMKDKSKYNRHDKHKKGY